MNPLIAEQLAADPRVAEAKTLIAAASEEHRARLTHVRPADPSRAQSYADTLKIFGDLRGGALFFPYLGSGIGNGALVELADGSVKFDMISGIGVHHWGHSHPMLTSAAFDAALQDTIMQGNLQQNVQCVALAQAFVESANKSGAKLDHCFLTSSGATANENAIKLLFQKNSPADRAIAFRHAFAGRTMALSQITDKPTYRQGLPITLNVDYLPYFDANRPVESTADAIIALQSLLSQHPKHYAFLCAEMVLGEGGFYPGQREFFRAVFQLARASDIAIWTDEVQTFGRTEELFAFQSFGLDDLVDVVTFGKMTQVCATLFRDDFKPRPGLISQTFTGSTSSIFAAKAILDDLTTGGYFGPRGKIATIREQFVNRFNAIAARHPTWLGGPYGHGAMLAFTPLDGSLDKAKSLLHAMFKNGVIAFYAGEEPTRVRFLPPIGVITSADVDHVCDILETSLAEVAA